MKIAIGLVVKGGKEWITNWVSCAEKIADVIFVVDNNADEEVKNILINHPKVKRYLIQKDLERNQSRDYQKILEMAREENCDWIWNIDIDEFIPLINYESLYYFLLNCEQESVAIPLIEMRNDYEHYIMILDTDGVLKHGRMVHKIYKTLSHFRFDEKDKHGQPIPHNCPRSKQHINVIVLHFGHMTKELRDEKRKKVGEIKDVAEDYGTWMEEDENKLTINHIDEAFKRIMNINNKGEKNV